MLTALARPLLFASVDREVARAGGVPVALLDAVFLLVLALAIAATSQLTGALLVFALLVAPPAARPADHPAPLAGLVLSVVFACSSSGSRWRSPTSASIRSAST